MDSGRRRSRASVAARRAEHQHDARHNIVERQLEGRRGLECRDDTRLRARPDVGVDRGDARAASSRAARAESQPKSASDAVRTHTRTGPQSQQRSSELPRSAAAQPLRARRRGTRASRARLGTVGTDRFTGRRACCLLPAKASPSAVPGHHARLRDHSGVCPSTSGGRRVDLCSMAATGKAAQRPTGAIGP